MIYDANSATWVLLPRKKYFREIKKILERCFSKEELDYLSIDGLDFLTLVQETVQKQLYLDKKSNLLIWMEESLVSVISSYRFLFKSNLDKQEVQDIFLEKIKNIVCFDTLFKNCLYWSDKLEEKSLDFFYSPKYNQINFILNKEYPFVKQILPNFFNRIKALLWNKTATNWEYNYELFAQKAIKDQIWYFKRLAYPEYQNSFRKQMLKELNSFVKSERRELTLPKFVSNKFLDEDLVLLKKWRSPKGRNDTYIKQS